MLRKWRSQNVIANPWPPCLPPQLKLRKIRIMKRILCFWVLVIATQLFAACVGGSTDENTAAKVRAGMAYDTGGKGDGSFNDAASAGLIKAQQDLGAELKELAAAINETDAIHEERLRLLASSGYIQCGHVSGHQGRRRSG